MTCQKGVTPVFAKKHGTNAEERLNRLAQFR
jgi:hypothetical protein